MSLRVRASSIWTAAAATVIATVLAGVGSVRRQFVGRPPAGSAFAGVQSTDPTWRFEGLPGSEKSASVPMPSPSASFILVQVQVGPIDGVIDPLIVDLMGPGYDNPEQEFHLSLRPSDAGRTFSRILFTGMVPKPLETKLRLFEYSGASLSVNRVSAISIHLGFVLLWLACFGFLVAATARTLAKGRGVTLDRARLAGFAEATRGRVQSVLLDPDLLLPALVALVVCVLVGRVIALPYPLLPSDEFPYAFRTRFGWRPLGGEDVLPVLPNFLYFVLFKSVHSFDGNAVIAARALNTLFFGLSALPIYRISRRFLDAIPAAILALLFCAGPTSSYAGYFMPEATYFLGFWIIVLVFVRLVERPTSGRAAATGLCLAALTLVKPHALVVVICFAAVLPVLRLFRPDGPPLRRLILLATVMSSSWYAAWFCLTYAFSGEPMFNPAGPAYQGLVAKYVLSTSNVRALVSGMIIVVGRHLAIVLLIFAVPASLLVSKIIQAFANRRNGVQSDTGVPLAIMSVVVLGALILMSAKLTVEVIGLYPSETIDRLHGRYFSFGLPLIVLAAASCRDLELQRGIRIVRLAVVIVAVLAGFLVVSRTPAPYVVDFPEGFALCTSPWLLDLAVLANLSAAVADLFRPVWSWRIVVVWLLVFSVTGSAQAFQGQRDRSLGSDEVRMGAAMREILRPWDRDWTLIASKNIDVRSFYLGLEILSQARLRAVSDLADGHCSEIPEKTRYIVTIDPIMVGCGFRPILKIGTAQLYERAPPTAAGGPVGAVPAASGGETAHQPPTRSP